MMNFLQIRGVYNERENTAKKKKTKSTVIAKKASIFFRQLTVAKKLYIGFGIIILIMISLGAFSTNQMSNMNEKTSQIKDKWLPSVQYLGQINALINKQENSLLYFVNYKDMEQRGKMEDVSDQLKTYITEYEKLISSPEEKQAFDEFTKAWDGYQQLFKEILGFGVQNSNRQTNLLMEAQVENAKIEGLIANLVEINDKGASRDSASAESTFQFGFISIIIYIVVAIVISVIIATVISRFI